MKPSTIDPFTLRPSEYASSLKNLLHNHMLNVSTLFPFLATSYTPKSISSAGQRFSWGQGHVDGHIPNQEHVTDHSLGDIDRRLENLSE